MNSLTLKQLKSICKHKNIKCSGNKKNIIDRIRHHDASIKIQSIYRRHLVKRYLKYKHHHKTFNNTEDFLTFESWNEISIHYIYSYVDNKGFRYGFHIHSIIELLERKHTNPYTRDNIPIYVKDEINTMIRLGNILGYKIKYKNKNKNKHNIKERINNIFFHFDRCGYFTDSQWFYRLTRIDLIKYFRELYDLWNYRAQLSNEVKQYICHPTGNPFSNIPIIVQFEFREIREYVVTIIERILYNGIDDSYKQLGCMYVLSILTLVSKNAARSIPWLYESVQLNNMML